MLKNMKIRNRMLCTFSLLIALSTLLVLFALNGLKLSNLNFSNFVDNEYSTIIAVKDCGIEGNNLARTLQDMALAADVKDLNIHKQEFLQGQERLLQKIAIIKQSATYDATLTQSYVSAMEAWMTSSQEILKQLESGNKQQAIQMIEAQTPLLGTVMQTSMALNKSAALQSTTSVKHNIFITNILSLICFIGLLLSIVLCIFLAFRITRSIVRPLSEIGAAAIAMSEGNLSSEIHYVSKDEVGDLANAMRNSLATLHTYIVDIDRAMDSMAVGNFNVAPSQPFIGEFKNIENSITEFIRQMCSMLNKMNQTAQQVSRGSSMVSQGSHVLAEGATEQASSVEELLAAITEISSQVSQNASNSTLANEMALNAATSISSSNTQMKNLMHAMDDINGKSGEIGKIIKTIEDIAFQTNILALNAAVEAARAGAAGKGFAVVADEVRNLATKSSEAAKNTTVLIESSIASVNKGVTLARATAQNLEGIVENAGATTAFISQIAKATIEESELLKQVSSGIEQVSAVIQTNSATSEESAAASEELAKQAESLKTLVNSFTLLQTNGECSVPSLQGSFL